MTMAATPTTTATAVNTADATVNQKDPFSINHVEPKQVALAQRSCFCGGTENTEVGETIDVGAMPDLQITCPERVALSRT
jgi:hypothetical protein